MYQQIIDMKLCPTTKVSSESSRDSSNLDSKLGFKNLDFT